MGLTEKANNYYKMFITWTNEKIRKTFVERNMFDFKHIKGFDRSYIQQPGPMVVLSKILLLCMISIQELFVIKSGLWWRAYSMCGTYIT